MGGNEGEGDDAQRPPRELGEDRHWGLCSQRQKRAKGSREHRTLRLLGAVVK